MLHAAQSKDNLSLSSRTKGGVYMPLCTRLVFVAFVFSIVQPALGQQAKKKVETAEQLPVHSYPVSGKASDLLNDDAAFARLTSALQKDLISDLQNYDIEDKSTLKKYYNSLMQIAYLTGDYNEAVSYLEKRDALEDKPAARAMAGLIDQPLIDGAKAERNEPRKCSSQSLPSACVSCPTTPCRTR